MTQLHPDDPRLRIITPGQVTQFLLRMGWLRIDSPNDRLYAFQGPPDDSGHPLEATLPKRIDYRDFFPRLADLFASLSVVSGREVDDIVRQVARINRDVLRSRVISVGGADLNSIGLAAAAEYVSNLRTLMSYAATVENNPRPYFGKASSVGMEFAQECRFGHTFRSSFGFLVETAPLPDMAVQNGEEFGTATFPRRVMERLARGFNAVSKGVRSEDLDAVAVGYQDGLNANLCEKVVEMSALGSRTAVEFFVAFGGTQLSRLEAASAPLILDEATVEYLEVAARRLRSIATPERRTIRGKVVELRSNFGLTVDETDAEYKAVMLWASEGVRVRMRLSSEQYVVVLDAHKAGRDIMVTGLLEKVGKRWSLSDPGPIALPA
jgi:hypothetical protein